MLPTATTQVYAVLGSPIRHSRSPLMHNTAFEALGLDCTYVAFDVNENTLPEAVEGLRALGVKGWNCTMPNKMAMARLCDHLSPAARIIGAVNTVVNEDGVLAGHSTDGTGFMLSLKDAGIDPRGKKITVLGVGGASTAIIVQAALDGVRDIAIFNRKSPSWLRTQPLIGRLGRETPCHIRLYDLNDIALLQQHLNESILLVNGTSVGMAPHAEQCPIPANIHLHPGLAVYDVIYNPLETQLLQRAKQAGCTTIEGLSLLLWQGAEAFRLWTGKQMPIDAVKKVLF